MPQPKEPRPMLTWEEDVEAAALRAQGWTIQAIARHLGRDPKTIRAYLAGERVPGRRRSSAPDGFAPFVDYVSARSRDGRDRPSAGRGDAVGLGGAARRALGRECARAGRGVVVLEPGPGGAGR